MAPADQPVMTVLEARIPAARWPDIQAAFAGGPAKPSQMLHGFLVQSATDPELWRAVSIWRSQAALREYRASVTTPGGVGFFQAAGADPSFMLFEVRGAA